VNEDSRRQETQKYAAVVHRREKHCTDFNAASQGQAASSGGWVSLGLKI